MADQKRLEKPKLAPNFLSGLTDELKKVDWPSRKQTIRLTGVVIIISLIVALYVGIIDIFLAKVLDYLTKIQN